jgi:hypothetical protein
VEQEHLLLSYFPAFSRKAALLFPWLLLHGCQSETLVVSIPFEPEHKSAVVAVELRDSVDLYSVDAATRNAQPVLRSIEDWNEEDPIALQVVRYEQSLEELRLPGPGSLISASFGRTLSVEEVLERKVDGSGLGSWSATMRWPDAFRDFRYGDPCRRVGAAWREPLPSDVVRFAGLIPRPDRTAIFVGRSITDRPIFFRITTAGAERLSLNFDRRAAYAFLGNDQRIYLMGGDTHPVIHAGDPETGFTVVTETTTPEGSWPHWSVMTESGVIFGIGPAGELYRIDGDDWRIAHRFPVVEFNDSAYVTAAGPEELYLIDPDGYGLHHYLDGAVTTEATEIDAELSARVDRLTVVKHLPEVGTFAGTDEGSVLQRGADGRWRVIQTALIIGREVWTLEAIDRGLLVGGFYGILDQFYPETGFCEEARFRYGNDLALQFLAPVDGGLAVVGFRLVSDGVRELFLAALTLQ